MSRTLRFENPECNRLAPPHLVDKNKPIPLRANTKSDCSTTLLPPLTVVGPPPNLPPTGYKINTQIYGLENLMYGKTVASSTVQNTYETEYQHRHR